MRQCDWHEMARFAFLHMINITIITRIKCRQCVDNGHELNKFTNIDNCHKQNVWLLHKEISIFDNQF